MVDKCLLVPFLWEPLNSGFRDNVLDPEGSPERSSLEAPFQAGSSQLTALSYPQMAQGRDFPSFPRDSSCLGPPDVTQGSGFALEGRRALRAGQRAPAGKGLRLFGNPLGKHHPSPGPPYELHKFSLLTWAGENLRGCPQTLPSLNLRVPICVLNQRTNTHL